MIDCLVFEVTVLKKVIGDRTEHEIVDFFFLIPFFSAYVFSVLILQFCALRLIGLEN